jgi:prolyl-tRNA editing enzyme YbaK/EbsC (Cys-tRNA(Pro) deacylase)
MDERKDGPGRFVAAAARLGVTVALKEFSESTRTAEEAAKACGCQVGQIVKSLIFKGRKSGTSYVMLVSGANRVDQKGAAATIGEALDRPDADHVRAQTGFAIGGIPPFGHDTALATFIDEDLFKFDAIWAAAGSPNVVFATTPAELERAAGAKRIKVT